MSDYNFLRSVKTVSFFTFLSRISGLIRDMLCANFFGTGMVWDAFTIAFRIPNLFRRLFGEGALSAAFVPVFIDCLEKRSTNEAWRLARSLTTIIIIILVGITVIGEVSFYLVPRLIDLQPKWKIVFDLLIIMFPYVMFICLVALSMAILNSLKHFFVPALTPIVLNICWITGVVVIAPIFGNNLQERAIGVALAILLAGFIQLSIQVPVLRSYGMDFRPIIRFLHPGIKQIFKLMGPTVFGLAVVQINVLIDSLIAVGFAPSVNGSPTFTFLNKEIYYPLQTGSASVLYYGDRLIEFPLGVFGIALANVIFPLFSTHASREDWEGFRSTFIKALRMVVFIGIPASAGLILLRSPLVELFYERNKFTAESTMRTIDVIFFYSLGIWGYCGLHVIVRAFYSLKDTKTPMLIGIYMVGVNLLLNLSLIWFLNVGGLALATSISAILQLIILTTILKLRLGIRFGGDIFISFLKTCLATFTMAVACIATLDLVSKAMPDNDIVSKSVRVFAPLVSAIIVFFLTSYLTRSDEMTQLARAYKK